MTDKRRAINLLRDNGFQLARSRKHHVYKNNFGRTVVLPSTPSDVNAWKAALADMKKQYGLVPEVYRPNARVRTPRPVPATPQPMPVEAIAATKPVTAEEQSLLDKWEREEAKRLYKEARLLNRWEHEDRQEHKKFVEWLQVRANMGNQQLEKEVERNPHQPMFAFLIPEVFMPFFKRCVSLG